MSADERRPQPLRLRAREGGQTVVLALIVLAVVGALVWWLFDSRERNERAAREFARDVATRLAFDLDRKLLDRVIPSERTAKYPPSFRDRLIANLRKFGRPTEPIEVTGDVYFVNHFFEPIGTFRAPLKYPGQPAELQFAISRPRGWWQIDDINVTWELPPPPEPPVVAPIGAATPAAPP